MAAISARLTDGFGPVMDCERGMGRGMGVGFEEEVGRIRAEVQDVLEGLDPRDSYYGKLFPSLPLLFFQSFMTTICGTPPPPLSEMKRIK